MMFKVVSEQVREGYCRRVDERVLAALDVAVCPECGSAVDEQEQVGWDMVARPCGCRVFQGRQGKWDAEEEGDEP